MTLSRFTTESGNTCLVDKKIIFSFNAEIQRAKLSRQHRTKENCRREQLPELSRIENGLVSEYLYDFYINKTKC